MANNQPCIPYSGTNAEGLAERMSEIIAKALGYPKRCASSVGLTVQSAWNGIGQTPTGWTKRSTTTWFSTATQCVVYVPSAMQTLLAAAPAQARLTSADKTALNAALATIVTADLDSYGAICPGSKERTISVTPVFMTAWEAWSSNHTVLQTDFGGTGNSPTNIYTDYSHRKPLRWGTGGSFDLWNFPGDPVIDTQTIHDARLLAFAGATEALSYDWYPDPDDFNSDPANRPLQSYIMLTSKAHRLSPNKDATKYFYMLDPHWWAHNTMPLVAVGDWGRSAAYTSRLAACAAESCYYKFNGHPVIGVYNYASLVAGDKTTWLSKVDAINTAVLASAGQSPYWVVQDYNQTTATDMLSKGARWKTVYGPNPTLQGATVQNPYSQQNIWDRATWDAFNTQLATSVVALQDRRCRSVGATAWVDPPTVRELMEAINAANGAYKIGVGKPEILCICSGSELSESGTIEETAQDGTKYLDAIRFARGGTVPSDYVEKVDAAYLSHVTTAGAWTLTAQMGATYQDSNVMRSSGGTGSKREYSNYRITKLEFAGEKGPGFGIANIYLDGVLQGAVDQYSSAPVAPAVLWSSGTLTQGLHTLAVEESGSKNASSSGNTISWDYTQQTIVP